MNLCIVGTGYVGLVTAACFAEMGNTVTCVDINATIIEKLAAGTVPIYEPNLEPLVRRNSQAGRLLFTTRLGDGIRDALFVFNCVGTPARPDGGSDLEQVFQMARAVGWQMNDYKIVVNKSTVPVGTAAEVRRIIAEALAERGVQIEFDVASNPEFLKEGDAVNDFMKPDRVVLGTDNVRTARLMEHLYAPFARSRDKLILMTIRSAEMTKYAANCMLAAKISFINEMANICERVDADIMEVRRGIGADHRIGHHFIYPGVGYGGSCFPKDVKALIATANAGGFRPLLMEAVHQVNEHQKLHMVQRVTAHFGGNGLQGRTLAVWGLAFKANTDDVRESAAILIIQRLVAAGADVRAFDPQANDKARAALNGTAGLTLLEDQYQVLQGADALLVLTDWNQFRNPDFEKIGKLLKAPVLFDGRNLYNPYRLAEQGFIYHGIGRPVTGGRGNRLAN
jgi:UDPglucose 6-dehydrogenase